MPVRDDLGTRMKHNYEEVSKTRLTRRMPVAIRLDGKAFHTFTRGFEKPFDAILVNTMQDTMKYLCKNIQGCVFGYTQSDEITLILIDYQTLETAAWFDYEVQKLCSVSASMATLKFNEYFKRYANNYIDDFLEAWNRSEKEEKYVFALENAMDKGAMFDSRCFNIPKEEVANLVYWRQLDAMRNSVQMVAQANFPHKELQFLSQVQLKEKLLEEKDITWEDFLPHLKWGTSCYKSEGEWVVDKNMPILKDDWYYIEKHILV